MLQKCYYKLKARKDASIEASSNPASSSSAQRTTTSSASAPTNSTAEGGGACPSCTLLLAKATHAEQFPIHDPMRNAPTGNPFILNPEEASMSRVGRKRKKRWQVGDSKPAPIKRPQGFSFYTVCKSCGRRRSEHVGFGRFELLFFTSWVLGAKKP
jgi:hypothetical protein